MYSAYDEYDLEEYAVRLNNLIREGDHKAVERYILEKKIPADEKFYELRYALFEDPNPVGLAFDCGNVAMIKTLLDLGFPKHEQYHTRYDHSHPIHLACEAGNLEIVKLLVEDYGVDITDLDSNGALHMAAYNRRVAVLDYFIERGISVDLIGGHKGTSSLHEAASVPDRVEVCRLLLSKGAKVDFEDFRWNTALIYAAENKSYDTVQLLFEAGAKINIDNIDGHTAFFKAVEHRDFQMMELLLSLGADPSWADRYQISPLHFVVSKNWYDEANFLVNKANVTLHPPKYYVELEEGESVCKLALREGRFEMVKLLIKAGYDPAVELAEYKVKGEEDRLQLEELRAMDVRPRSLFSQCVLAVRRVLGRRLPVDLDRLPVPEVVKQEVGTCCKKQDS